MLRFKANQFVWVLNTFNSLESIINTIGNGPLPQSLVQSTLPQLEWLISELEILGLNVTLKRAKLLKWVVEQLENPSNFQVNTIIAKKYLEDTRDRLQDELEGKVIYFVSDRAQLVDSSEPLFGVLVDKQFPSAAYEIEEAGKCLAFRRSTACVAHLMRTLEIGLGCLAGALGLTFNNASWNTIIGQIEKAIKGMSSATHGANWKADEQFYSEAAAHFHLLKNAWRNHTMHVRERYDEERAETVFYAVRGFMQHLATRLSEPDPSPPVGTT